MMAEFSHRSLHGARAGRRKLLAVTAFILLLFLIDAVSGGSVRSLVRTIGADIWRASGSVRSAIGDSGYFRSHRSLAEENAALKDQLAQYEEKAAGYDVLVSENAQLRAAQHIAAETNGITAPVVSSFRTSPYGTFMIGAGTSDPIGIGDIVLSDGGFVIGTVTDVQAQTAQVRGIFTSGERTDVIVGAAAVTLEGDGGGNAHASVPLGVMIAAGDPVVSNVYGGRPVGVVGKVDVTPTSADQTIYVQLPVNLSALRYVYVIHR